MLNISAQKNPSTLNPDINPSAIKIIIALITSKNNPRVRIVTGIVRIINNGFRVMFNKPKTIATISAETKLVTFTPGKM